MGNRAVIPIVYAIAMFCLAALILISFTVENTGAIGHDPLVDMLTDGHGNTPD